MDLASLFQDILGGLPGYPLAVRVLAGLWVAATFALLVLIPTLKPAAVEKTFTIDTVRQKQTGEGLTAFELTMRNPTSGPVTVNAVELEFYQGTRPTGGLQSGARSPVTYRVFEDDQGSLSNLEPGDLTSPVTVRKPFDGVDYSIVELDTSAALEAGEALRLLVVIEAAGLHGADADTVSARARYNGTEKTTSVTASLRR